MAPRNEHDEMIVAKSNDLIQHSYIKEDQKNNEMTTQEQRLWDFLVSKIDPNATKFVPVSFNIYEYCRTMNLEYNGRVYRDIQQCLDSFASKKVWITETNYDGKTRDVLCHWVANVIMYPNSGAVEVHFDEFMGPYLLLKKNANATIYDALWTRDCKSKYSRRLYEYCKSCLTERDLESGDVLVAVNALRTAMYADKLKYFSDFKRRALQPAMQDINDFSPYSIEMSLIEEKPEDMLNFHFMRKDGVVERIPAVTISYDEIPADVRARASEQNRPAAAAIEEPDKLPFGEYRWVRMTEEKHVSLINTYGESIVEQAIRYIDESAQTTNNKNGWADWYLIVKRCIEGGWYRTKETAPQKKTYSRKTFTKQKTMVDVTENGEEMDPFVVAAVQRRLKKRENGENNSES